MNLMYMLGVCLLEVLPTRMLDLSYRFGQCPLLCICYVLLLNQQILYWYKRLRESSSTSVLCLKEWAAQAALNSCCHPGMSRTEHSQSAGIGLDQT